MSLLASIYALIGADLSQLDRQFSSAVKKGGKAGADMGREFQSSLKRSLSSGAAFGTGGMAATMGLDGVGSLLDSLKQKFAAIGQVGGVDYAAQIQRQSVAYTKLFGSASKARDVIKQIQKDSVETGTSSLDNLAALRKFNALPVAKEALPGILRTTNDTAAAYGLNGGERRRLVDNIGDIFGNGFDKAQSNQFQMLGLNVEKTLSLGLGKTFRTEAEALAGVKGMSATDQGNAFIRGLEKQFGGMGKQTAEGTLLGRLEQAKELALQAGEASGALAVTLLTPLAGGLVSLAGGLKAVNDATGGGAGLIAMLIAGGVVLYGTVRTGWMAWTTLKLLNGELRKMAANSGAAAVTQRLSTGTNAATNVAMGAGGAAAGSRFGALGALGARALASPAFVPMAIVAGTVASFAGAAYLDQHKNDGWLQQTGNVLAPLLLGGGAGLFDAVKGLGFAGSKMGSGESAPEKLQKAADSLAKAGDMLKSNFSSIGGNARINSALTTLESAYSLQGAF